MIANLVTTLLLALGVATGNITSNSYKSGNAFNHVEKLQEKPKRKNAAYNEEYNYSVASYYYSNYNDYQNYKKITDNTKYYINNEVSVNTDFGTIYNTTYITNEYYDNLNTNGLVYTKMLQLIKFTPYITSYNTNIEYKSFIQYTRLVGTGTTTLYIDYNIYKWNDNIDNLYDLTNNYELIGENLPTSWLGIDFQNYTLHGEKLKQQNTTTTINENISSTTNVEIEVDIGTLQEETQIILQLSSYANVTNPNVELQTIPTDFHISGITQETNYEVVDIPNLMYTILTLPFAWYSTAFNLTIFKGTPYAINFGNIILTIVAALILMYLIKKVIR